MGLKHEAKKGTIIESQRCHGEGAARVAAVGDHGTSGGADQDGAVRGRAYESTAAE